MSEKVCVITGGTSGLGKANAEAMRRRGYTVYELSRRETGLAGFRHIPTDVTKPEMVEAAVAEILRQETHIDVLINNAGFGVSGAVEFTEADRVSEAEGWCGGSFARIGVDVTLEEDAQE